MSIVIASVASRSPITDGTKRQESGSEQGKRIRFCSIEGALGEEGEQADHGQRDRERVDDDPDSRRLPGGGRS